MKKNEQLSDEKLLQQFYLYVIGMGSVTVLPFTIFTLLHFLLRINAYTSHFWSGISVIIGLLLTVMYGNKKRLWK